ncbi:GNAT family N-acetyltransferase [Micromonospora cathayae]|uniref:GNAT family N-acetyltransferase n=1 Tax=Micromonospora cathayae TaxID=3028804 RepID=A0ABY7ZYB4_9ACTN|nr:GNAT family N-acetyltransferase [Micromonospora sp. HUAS 3]WDZ86993.1 GNAT family N-acetyltransferase [Micromonospora sp. HUAS 3]
MEPVEIIEDGLLLRPWRATDADDVHRACQDPDIQRWTTVPRPYLPEHALGFVTEVSPAGWSAGTSAAFAVCAADTGQLLGSCGLVSVHHALRSAEIGYWTAPWARGRNVAARATRAVARWGFGKLGLRRLVWQAELGNHGSRLAALRAGFRVEGQLRLADPADDGGPDAWIGSLLPGEVPEPGAVGPAGPGSLDARRAAVFGRPHPELFATVRGVELRLRAMDERDLDALATTCRDPESIRWTSVPDPYRHSDAQRYLAYHRSSWAAGRAACFTIADPDDAYVGNVDLRISPVEPALGDVGFLTAPHARGRGYLPAALAALTAWGFTTLGLARIEWRANVGNTASRRAAEKAGFRMEGTARAAIPYRDTRVDAWVGAVVAEDLAGHRPA